MFSHLTVMVTVLGTFLLLGGLDFAKRFFNRKFKLLLWKLHPRPNPHWILSLNKLKNSKPKKNLDQFCNKCIAPDLRQRVVWQYVELEF